MAGGDCRFYRRTDRRAVATGTLLVAGGPIPTRGRFGVPEQRRSGDGSTATSPPRAHATVALEGSPIPARCHGSSTNKNTGTISSHLLLLLIPSTYPLLLLILSTYHCMIVTLLCLGVCRAAQSRVEAGQGLGSGPWSTVTTM